MKLKYSIKSFAFVWALVASTSAWAENRITGPVDPAKRCTELALDDTNCEIVRQNAKNAGYISEEEYVALRNYGAFPTFGDLFNEGKIKLTGWCPCGCFHPETLISVLDKTANDFRDVPAEKITFSHSNYKLVHLDEASQLRNFAYDVSDIRVPTFGPEAHPLFVIETKEGQILKLTERHPVMTARGEMVQARELKVEDGLVNYEGQPIEISLIKREQYDGNVVNFMVDRSIDHKLEHVIFAEKIAIGDLAWQSSLEDDLNQIILRQ